MRIEDLLEHLRASRKHLEIEFEGRLEQLENTIRFIERELEIEKLDTLALRATPGAEPLSAPDGGAAAKPSQDSSQLTTGGIVKPTPPRRGTKPDQVKADSNGVTAKNGGRRGGARAIREFVDSATEEFNPHSLASLVGCTHSAVSCALLKLQKDGVIERVRYGWYRRVMPHPPKAVANEYAKFREALGELKAPSIALSTCGRGDE